MSKPFTITFPTDDKLPEYVIIEGVRYNRETDFQAQRRRDYEPGGQYYHLRNETDH